MQIIVKGRHYFEAIKGTDEEAGEKFANAGMRYCANGELGT